MPTHVALLRGINVGGRNKVAMADLREVVASLGHTDVATYIQSGNVVLTSKSADQAALAGALEREIAKTLGVKPGVVVLSQKELAQVVARNPFADETNPKLLHAVFRSGGFGPDQVAEITAAEQRATQKGGSDEARVVGGTLYLHTPDGLGRSDLARRLTRPAAQTTARNWATVTKLLELLDEP